MNITLIVIFAKKLSQVVDLEQLQNYIVVNSSRNNILGSVFGNVITCITDQSHNTQSYL